MRSKVIRLELLLAGIFLFCGCENYRWKKAQKKNTIEAYEEFIKDYPESEWVNEAKGHIAFLNFQLAVRENSYEAYVDYIKRFPGGANRPLAIAKLLDIVSPEVDKLSKEDISRLKAVIKTDFGEITIRFLADVAPLHCKNFIKLARAHFYDKSSFHQAIPDTLIKGGGPLGDPEGGPGYTLKAEFSELKHKRGTVGMARMSHPDSAGSQFYICLKEISEFDSKYTIFAEVTSGIEVVEAISRVQTNGAIGKPYPFTPLEPVEIKTIEIISP